MKGAMLVIFAHSGFGNCSKIVLPLLLEGEQRQRELNDGGEEIVTVCNF